jgi:hypothetical protein
MICGESPFGVWRLPSQQWHNDVTTDNFIITSKNVIKQIIISIFILIHSITTSMSIS